MEHCQGLEARWGALGSTGEETKALRGHRAQVPRTTDEETEGSREGHPTRHNRNHTEDSAPRPLLSTAGTRGRVLDPRAPGLGHLSLGLDPRAAVFTRNTGSVF